jgi:hypothetical protein
MLAAEPLLLLNPRRAPEFNDFLLELCRSAGFRPIVNRGTVCSIQAAADLVVQERGLLCVPASSRIDLSGLIRRPLVQPVPCYPWSLFWRADDHSCHVRELVAAARRLSRDLSWLEPPHPSVDQVSRPRHQLC